MCGNGFADMAAGNDEHRNRLCPTGRGFHTDGSRWDGGAAPLRLRSLTKRTSGEGVGHRTDERTKGAVMPTLTEPRELLVHELGDLLFAEQLLTKTLPKLAEEASDKALRSGFEKHLEETREHVENLEQVFELLGEPAKAERCPGIEGIKAEQDAFVAGHDPWPEMCDLFLTGAGARAEHYEIAAYSGVINLARSLGEDKAVDLLEKNLVQEKKALATLESAAKKLGGATKASRS